MSYTRYMEGTTTNDYNAKIIQLGRTLLEHHFGDRVEDNWYSPYVINNLLEEYRDVFGNVPYSYLPDPYDEAGGICVKNPYCETVPRVITIGQHIRGKYAWKLRDFFENRINKGHIPPSDSFVPGKKNETERVRMESYFCYQTGDRDVVLIDILVRADIKALRADGLETYHYDVPFRLYVYYDLLNTRLEISAKLRSQYTSAEERPDLPMLNQYLLREFQTADIEEDAALFRARYIDDPEDGDNRNGVCGLELAKRMGLDIRFENLSRDGKVHGKLFFDERSAVVYDESGKGHVILVPEKTILLDKRLRYDIKKLHATIIHECNHYEDARNFYLLQKEYAKWYDLFEYGQIGAQEVLENSADPAFSGSTDKPETSKELISAAIDAIEWHARRMTPRIQMPQKHFMVAAEYMLGYFKEHGLSEIETVAKTIDCLSDYFQVSRQSAKIRMEELGFYAARGVYNYSEDHYIPGFVWKAGSLKEDETFCISAEEALKQYIENPRFRKQIDTGAFVFVENHFCLNTPTYICIRNGVRGLTRYAREHMDECCLVFRICFQRDADRYHAGVFFSQQHARKNELRYEHETEEEMLARYSKEIDDTHQRKQELPPTFSRRLVYYMNKRHVTSEKLEELTGVSYSTIERYRTKPEKSKTLQNVIAICIALHIPPDESLVMVGLAGFCFDESKTHCAYAFVLNNFFDKSVGYCNWILKRMGYKHLTSLDDFECASA